MELNKTWFEKCKERVANYHKNGLAMCEKCGTPKECYIKLDDGDEYIAASNCKCRQEEYNELHKEQIEKERIEKIKELRRIGLRDKNLWNYTFENDDGQEPDIKKLCEAYVNGFEEFRKKGQGLILSGTVGTGKTYYAACIANALIEKGIKVRFTSLTEVIQMANDFNYAEENFYDLVNNSLIILDDLGTERSTPFAHEQIYKFINYCNTNNKPLVITTNYSLDDFRDIVKKSTDLTFARIYSRVLENGYQIIVNKVMRRQRNEQIKTKNFEEVAKKYVYGDKIF